jgi:membrane-associated PAP2 superfamily phosphatase
MERLMSFKVPAKKYLPLIITFFVFIITLILFHHYNWDIILQDKFYDSVNHEWIVAKSSIIPRLIFYKAIKYFIVTVGVIFILIYGFVNKKIRRKLHIVILSLIFVPLIVSGLKQFTNSYCPSQTIRYGGTVPNIKLFEVYPEDFHPLKKGKCFPAGHASGGFALMSLYFVSERKQFKIAGFFIGLLLGWVMGGYQMLNGQHYVSDTIISMILSFLVILIIDLMLTSQDRNNILYDR